MIRGLSLAWLRLSALLPLRALHGLGRLLGLLLSAVPTDVTRTTRRNLDLCFPAEPEAVRRKLARRSLQHQCCAVTELGPVWFRSPPAVLALIEQVTGEALLQTAHESGGGVIALLPHIGAWELAGQFLNARFGSTALYAPGRYQLDDVIRARRQRDSCRMVGPDQAGMRALLKTLKQGRMVLLLPDQNPRVGAGVFAPFFGRATYTMQLLSRLAMTTGATTLVVFAERRFRSRGFHLHVEPADGIIHSGPLEASVAAVNNAVENVVRRFPEQYLWHYKRFKQRPDGEPWPYD